MEEEKIRSYLERQDFIGFQVHQEELDHPDELQRYFQLLGLVGSQPALARKFCGRWGLSFAEDCGPALWESQGAVDFVQKLGEAFPYLFFLAEKEGETLKLLVMLTCQSDQVQGDNLSLDPEKFSNYLKKQLKGLLLLSEKAGLSPENAQGMIQDIYGYFGLAD